MLAPDATAADSAAGSAAALTCVTAGMCVSSKSMPWISTPLSTAASRGVSRSGIPSTGCCPPPNAAERVPGDGREAVRGRGERQPDGVEHEMAGAVEHLGRDVLDRGAGHELPHLACQRRARRALDRHGSS